MRASAPMLAVLLSAIAPPPIGRTASPGPPWLEIGGYVENDSAYRLESPHHFQKAQTRLALEAEVRISEALRLTTAGRLIYDPPHRLVGPDPDFGQRPIDRWYVTQNGALELELRELHLDWTGEIGPARIDLRLGKQQIVWGQAFRLRVLDAVNAMDFREFVLDDNVDARIPVFGARLDASLGVWTFQGFVLPDWEPDRIPDPSSEFAFDPELRGGLPGLAPPGPLASSITNESFVILEDPREFHDWRLGNTAFGVSVAGVWKGCDLSLHYLDARDPRVTFTRRIERMRVDVIVAGGGIVRLNPRVNFLQEDHLRVRTIGASFAKGWGDFVFWGEGAFAFGRGFSVGDLADGNGIVRRPELQGVLALDWRPWPPLFVNLQAIPRFLPEYGDGILLDRFGAIFSLLLRMSLLNDKLFPQVFAFWGIEEGAWFEAALTWELLDRVSAFAGVDLFFGPRPGVFGQYAHRRKRFSSPANVTLVDDSLLPDPPSGRTSRVFLGVRYYFDLSF